MTYITQSVIQRRIDAAIVSGRGRVANLTIAEKEIEVKRPFQFTHLWGGGIRGVGSDWTRFYADFDEALPPEDRVLFRVTNVRRFRGGSFGVAGKMAAVAVHRSVQERPNNTLMTSPIWEDVQIDGWTGVENGFVHTARAFADDERTGLRSSWQNDEQATYRNVNMDGGTGSLIVLGHAQCKDNVIDRCSWNGPGRYGVDATGEGYWGQVEATPGMSWRGGSFHATHCHGGASGIAEFGIGRPNGPNAITGSGSSFENVRRLVEMSRTTEPGTGAGPSTASNPLTIEDVRVAFGRLAEDGFGIWYLNGGPLRLLGGTFGEGGDRPPRIYHGSLGGLVTIVEGVSFGAAGAIEDGFYPVVQLRVGQSLVAMSQYLRTKGNLYADRDGQSWVREDWERETVNNGIHGWA